MSEENKTPKKTKVKKYETRWNFPKYGMSVMATSLEEATKKLKNELEK